MIVIGVDAGGSQTHAASAQDGTLVREARGPAANPSALGMDAAAAAIVSTIQDVLAGAAPAAIYVGAAGAGRLAIAAALRAQLATVYPAARLQVGDDASIALRAAIPDGDGAVLIAGTGSIAYAERGGNAHRLGGLGWLAGDEGAGFWIALQAVKLYGRVLDARAPRDETTDLVAAALDAPDRDRYLAALYDAPLRPATLAALAPRIIALAGAGNRASTKIVQQAALELGDLAKGILRAAGLTDAPRIALAGGLLRENSLLSFLLETRLNGDVPGVEIVKGGDEAVHGALRLAARMAG
ncbi:MAG TPA: BadF/BadG/BcrA/BcrD ATPase family protein [Candidatus Sulfotelmatobacter sp.]|nr:BadF/BadG/BcrA/BcrD ATPase family protein [Candidatus Sulfotelmatobacter sp.]